MFFVSCSAVTYRFGGSDWGYGDGQVGQCMGRSLGLCMAWCMGAWVGGVVMTFLLLVSCLCNFPHASDCQGLLMRHI